MFGVKNHFLKLKLFEISFFSYFVGFGFKKTNNDNWICHQDDFNDLLSELNASHGRTSQENEEKVISLEEKSKAAKKRVQ